MGSRLSFPEDDAQHEVRREFGRGLARAGIIVKSKERRGWGSVPCMSLNAITYKHAPEGYVCPFCLVARGIENEHVLTQQTDVIFQDDDLTAFVCSHQFASTPGHTLVIPNAHYENIYELPVPLLHKIHELAQDIARAMKPAYDCDGVTMWQSNEPAGTQTVWHYHLHVIPRFANDGYFRNLADLEGTYTVMEPKWRAEYARRLKARLSSG